MCIYVICQDNNIKIIIGYIIVAEIKTLKLSALCQISKDIFNMRATITYRSICI